MIILRKASSALRLLCSENPREAFRLKLGENARQWKLSFHGKKEFFYTYSEGFQFVVLPDAPETREIYIRKQNYEETELAVIRRWLVPGDFVVDCGANVGLIAAFMANCVHETGCTLALEPAPETARRLAQVVKALGLQQVVIKQKCVSDSNGQVLFEADAVVSERSALLLTSVTAGTTSRTCCVESVRMDDLLAEAARGEPALVKLDIEGAEPLALRGWERLSTSKNPSMLIFEVYPRGLARLESKPEDIFKNLPKDCYDFWAVNFSWPNDVPELPRGVPFSLRDPASHCWPIHSNVIALPRHGKFASRRSRLASILPDRPAPRLSCQKR